MGRVWYTSELRALGVKFQRLADWFEHEPAKYDADALARKLELDGLLDPSDWTPMPWVMDAVFAGRCKHTRGVWADAGYRAGLICRDCLSCTYDGSFEDPVRMPYGEPMTHYPDGAALTPIADGDCTMSWFEIFVVGCINGSRDAVGWMAYVRACEADG